MESLPEIIKRAQKGDKQAYGQIYKLYYSKIVRYCMFNTSSREQAQDIAQETFLKAWKALPSFSTKKGGTIQAFLFRIARNLIIDLSRKKKVLPLEVAGEVESNENLFDNLERKDSVELVQKALSKLDETDRSIVILRYFEEIPSAEAAKILKMSDGALRVKTHRAIKKLKEILGERA